MKVVFIMGAGHCGSTLLDLILGSHSKAFSLGEFKQFNSRLQASEAGSGEVCGVCAVDCPVWQGELLKKLKPVLGNGQGVRRVVTALGRRLRNPYKTLNESIEQDVIIDSSKHPIWIRNRLAPRYLWKDVQPYLIYLHRDGRAVTNSYFRKYPERTYPVIVDDWLQQVAQMESYFEEFDAGPKLKLGYESLADATADTAESLCKFLGLDFEPGMLGYWQHDHHHLGGNGGTRHLIFRYREQFGGHSEQMEKRIVESKQHYSHEYYDATRIAIKLDERWRDELSVEQLQVFEERAQPANAGYVYQTDDAIPG